MRQLRRVALIVAGVLIILGASGWIGLRLYLTSSQAKQAAATRLSEMIGLPVEVESLHVGGSTSSMTFRIYSPGDSGQAGSKEIARVDSATADVSLWSLLTGQVSPKEITLS